MPRYIDTDKLQEELEKDKSEALDFGDCVAAHDIDNIINLINSQPTADVVPRELYESLKNENIETIKAIAESKRAYAREIFEEIDKIMKSQRYLYCNPSLNYVYTLIEKLKKKYTEENNND